MHGEYLKRHATKTCLIASVLVASWIAPVWAADDVPIPRPRKFAKVVPLPKPISQNPTSAPQSSMKIATVEWPSLLPCWTCSDNFDMVILGVGF